MHMQSEQSRRVIPEGRHGSVTLTLETRGEQPDMVVFCAQNPHVYSLGIMANSYS